MCHSRENGNPGRIRSPVKLGMTGGDGSSIRSASLSVEDDTGVCHSHENGNPGRTGSPIRSASLSVEDDKGAFG